MNSKLLWRILILFVAAFLIFSLGKNLYQNWKINQEVEKLKVEISDLRKANDTFTEKLLYYQSQSYREKIARERFGLQKPGEEVVVIVPEARPKIVEEKPVDKTPNYQKWWNYFFGVDK
ncbi:MAG: septum formation initiator family protein [bacterium]